MTVCEFLFLLATSSIATIVMTEMLKWLLNKTDTPYRANAVALDSAMLSSTGVSILYRLSNGFSLGYSPVLVYRLVTLILCTWFASMLVYDKIKQFVDQHREFKRLKKDK